MKNDTLLSITDIASRINPFPHPPFAGEPLRLRDLPGDSDAFAAASLYRNGHPVLIVAPDSRTQERLRREIGGLIGDESVAVFPSRDAVPYNMKSPFGPVTEERLRTLSRLLDNERLVTITTSAALLQRTVPPRRLFGAQIRIAAGDEIPVEKLCGWLVEGGFTRETMVEGPGQFAVRGGIVDIYPFVAENPLRIEYFGDTIDSIRSFDIFKQRSLAVLPVAQIFPMREFPFSTDDINTALSLMEEHAQSVGLEQRQFDKLRHAWKTVGDAEGAEWFLSWFSTDTVSLFDYLSKESILLWDDCLSIERRFKEDVANYQRHLERVADVFAPFVSPPEELLFSTIDMRDELLRRPLLHCGLDEAGALFDCGFSAQPTFGGSMPLVKRDVEEKIAKGFTVRFVCETVGHAQRLSELFSDAGITAECVIGYLERGFVDEREKVAVYAEIQAFDRPRHAAAPVKKTRNAAPIAGFDAVSRGDFVVHVDHGIGRFMGIERVTAGAAVQDCMVLTFHENAKVYVPVGDLAKVQKYIGKDGATPSLSRLGTATWEKQKEKTREALRELAQNLVALYAKRQFMEGNPFPPDGAWQKEFEEAFVYDPTVDQVAAVKDIKNDMESKRPMDRLVCGDVGFGKTEVAMRAAFKAASSGRQVAILAPTTILAAQHYATFCERMAEFPVRITLLSRFQKGKETKDELAKIASGAIDIVIGTHRILSQDVKFTDLGLLIIDEEQRFGVAHKERLKELRTMVDVLSLSATPIPRTLHMSLAGIRDLSLINTPPRNRLPVETHVLEYRDEVIKTAVENELFRGGQVYVVHNRISALEGLRDTIEQLVPQARVVIAHGQMDEDELAHVMKTFVAGGADVLLATSIIENGLDISNCNTIIVNRADLLGLSQLYQLRGRVGRSSEQAYAYVLVPDFNELSEVSLKRLKALEQFTDLGSGFQIAMRDLEIRGAGNLLGYDQHGSIAVVGFEMYNRLLREEIDALLGRAPESGAQEVVVELPVSAFIPNDYVPDAETRVAVYRSCADCGSEEDVDDKERELADRFGPLPAAARTLMSVLRLRVLARRAGIGRVGLSDSTLLLTMGGTQEKAGERVKAILSASERPFSVAIDAGVLLRTELVEHGSDAQLAEITVLLRGLPSVAA